MNRSIWLATEAPEILLSTFPNHRVLNDVYIYFSSWATTLDPTLVYDITDLSVADEEGNTMPLDDLLETVGGLMYSDYAGEIRITNSQAQALQALPDLAIYNGTYTDPKVVEAAVSLTGGKLRNPDMVKLAIDARVAQSLKFKSLKLTKPLIGDVKLAL